MYCRPALRREPRGDGDETSALACPARGRPGREHPSLARSHRAGRAECRVVSWGPCEAYHERIMSTGGFESDLEIGEDGKWRTYQGF